MMCKGSCCDEGEQHAFLSVFTMRNYMDKHPTVSVEDVLKLYMSYIGEERVENSCVNKSKTGCVLPRELRSDVCNAYYCDPIKGYLANIDNENKVLQVFVVQRAYSKKTRFENDADRTVVNVDLKTTSLL